MKLDNSFLDTVIGYDDVKEELGTICEWFNDDELLNNKKISLPRGLLLYGDQGCGKTLIMREFAKAFNCETFVIENTQDTYGEITNKYAAARKCKKAVVIIDEIDHLITNDQRCLRALQTELDGYNNSGIVFSIAATNRDPLELPSSLLRNGRIDRRIFIEKPDTNTKRLLFKKMLTNLGINLKEDEIKYISLICCGVSCIDIKQICNDAYLLHKSNASLEDLEKSYSRIVLDEYVSNTSNKKDYNVAIHEAGHYLVSMKYSKDFKCFKTNFNSTGGVANIYDTDEKKDTVEKRFEKIDIILGGECAEKIIFGKIEIGAFSDNIKAHDLADRLLTRTLIYGKKYYYEGSSCASQKMLNRRETGIFKIVNKREKKVMRYLRQHKKELLEYANELYASGNGGLKESLPVMQKEATALANEKK